LEKIVGSVAFITTACGLVAIILNELFGELLIGMFFSAELKAVQPILTILLLGVCAEAIFGPVDEVLKIAGQQKMVGWIYGVGVSTFLIGCILVINVGLIWIAWLQVAYVLGIFLAMNIAVQREFGFLILPKWPDLRLLRKLR
jgi:hypothetical protein